ncbi:hypothetical protein YC2023_025645 [Brassica napus]
MLKIGLHESRRPIYNIHVVNVDPITSLNVEYLEKLYSKIILSEKGVSSPAATSASQRKKIAPPQLHLTYNHRFFYSNTDRREQWLLPRSSFLS